MLKGPGDFNPPEYEDPADLCAENECEHCSMDDGSCLIGRDPAECHSPIEPGDPPGLEDYILDRRFG